MLENYEVKIREISVKPSFLLSFVFFFLWKSWKLSPFHVEEFKNGVETKFN
jgi:hypothetical protein